MLCGDPASESRPGHRHALRERLLQVGMGGVRRGNRRSLHLARRRKSLELRADPEGLAVRYPFSVSRRSAAVRDERLAHRDTRNRYLQPISEPWKGFDHTALAEEGHTLMTQPLPEEVVRQGLFGNEESPGLHR